MGIPIEKRFVVAAPAAAVWEFLTDPAKVASCLPGAAITNKEGGEGGAGDEVGATWLGTMTVKVGPVTASYKGKLRFERLDAEAREAEIAASGQETRGKGGADMRMKSRVVERGPRETEVTVASDVNVVGVLAQFGRGMIQDVSDQLFRKFTEAMRRQLEAPEAEEARVAPRVGGEETRVAARVAGEETVGREAAMMVETATTTPPPSQRPASTEDVLDVGALGSAALGRAAMRTLRRPAFWIGVAAVVLIVYWWVTR